MGFVILQRGLTIVEGGGGGDLVALFPLLKGEGRAFNSWGGC